MGEGTTSVDPRWSRKTLLWSGPPLHAPHHTSNRRKETETEGAGEGKCTIFKSIVSSFTGRARTGRSSKKR